VLSLLVEGAKAVRGSQQWWEEDVGLEGPVIGVDAAKGASGGDPYGMSGESIDNRGCGR
jgi:hypothetical protein